VVDHVSVDGDFQSELQFMEDLGGPDWSQTYVLPFYTKVASGAPEHEVTALLPRLRTLALELTSDDVASMLKMQWRIQRAWQRGSPSLDATRRYQGQFIKASAIAAGTSPRQASPWRRLSIPMNERPKC
jgi:hypothetical protein